jgi:hypothetical protein
MLRRRSEHRALGFEESGYAMAPSSGMSRPLISASSSLRMPIRRSQILKNAIVIRLQNTTIVTASVSCAANWPASP